MQVNAESITKQLFRAYNARGVVSPGGATGLSPVFMIGGAAHPSIATQFSAVVSQTVIAGAAVTGGAGLIVPANAQGQLAVVTDISVAPSATVGFYEILIDGPTADTDYVPTVFPTNLNTQNIAKATVPFFWGYLTNTVTPVTGVVAGLMVAGSAQQRFSTPPFVLTAGWGIVVKSNTNNLTYGVDIRFEVFEQTPS